MTRLTLQANAKINLTLGITGKRVDGYHEIDTVMQSVNLYDTVRIKKNKKINVDCSINEFSRIKNIAYSAAELFFKETGVIGGAEIEIRKEIPTAAGLGGGSADAAATLIGLDKLYETDLTYEKLCKLALQLGADVPFFIKGGTARATGIGEVLNVLSPLISGYFVLIKNDDKPSTAEMYHRLDSSKIILPDTEKALKAISANDIKALSECLVNSFSAVWDKSRGKEALRKIDTLGVSLSGSGPVWFALFDNDIAAKAAISELENQKIDCWLVRPCNFGIKIV